VSRVFTAAGGFTSGIEGPACDAEGNVYAVNFDHRGTIGKVTPDGEAGIFVELPNDSTGNGIRFNSLGLMLIADYVNHNILQVDMESREVSVYAHNMSMSQPNDLAIGANDIVYASDPDWNNSTGRIWRIGADGSTELIASELGLTNGIEVSPDERTLYVNETKQSNVLAFDLSPDGQISNKRLLVNLEFPWLDGMRCDVEGNLYITRQGGGTVYKVSPEGDVLLEVELTGPGPSNLAFGGPDGRTVYVTMTGAGHRNIEAFRVEAPGRSWQLFEDRKPTLVASDDSQPEPYSLLGNFPNPFNGSTVIEYRLRESAEVEIAVLNMLGQQIDVVKRGFESAGVHSVRWNPGDRSTGVYFCRMAAGGRVETKKMMYVR